MSDVYDAYLIVEKPHKEWAKQEIRQCGFEIIAVYASKTRNVAIIGFKMPDRRREAIFRLLGTYKNDWGAVSFSYVAVPGQMPFLVSQLLASAESQKPRGDCEKTPVKQLGQPRSHVFPRFR